MCASTPSSDEQSFDLLGAAETLARCSFDGRTRFRIATDNPNEPATVLMEYERGRGWIKRHGAPA